MIIGVDISVLCNEIQRNYCKGTCSSSTRYMNQSSTTAELSAGSHSNSHDADVQPVPLWPWRLFVARRWFESKQFMRNIKRRKRFTYVSCDRCTIRSIENPYRALMALYQHKKLLQIVVRQESFWRLRNCSKWLSLCIKCGAFVMWPRWIMYVFTSASLFLRPQNISS